MTSNKTCQAVPVFPVAISNRGVSRPYSCLREGYIYVFVKFRHGASMYETVTGEAIGCDRYFPAAVRNELTMCLDSSIPQCG